MNRSIIFLKICRDMPTTSLPIFIYVSVGNSVQCKSQTDLATGLNMCLEMNAWCLAEEGELATIQSCKTCDNAAGFYMIPPTTGECIPV